jgi:hypothetical protein
MIALITAVVSMVVAITAAVILAVSHQEMDDRGRQSWFSALVVGTLATVLTVCLNPEIVLQALACLAYVLAISGIVIVTKVTGITTMVGRAVIRWRQQRHDQKAVPDASLSGTEEPSGQSSAGHSPNSQHPDVDATTTGSA